MQKTLLVITFALATAYLRPVYSYGSNTVFPIMHGDTVCVFDISSRILKPVFIDSTHTIIRSSFKVSPSGKYISMDGYWLKYYSKVCEEELGESHGVFLVIDIETGSTISLCNVMGNTWSPSEDCLVYTEGYMWHGSKDDPLDEYYLGKTVKIFDPATGETTELVKGLEIPDNVAWSEYDNNIYIEWVRGVKKYNPVTGRLVETNYRGVNISPDGNYCFFGTVEGDPAILYKNYDNSPVTLVSPSGTEMDADSFYPYFLDWGNISGKTVAYIDFEGLYYIDCATGRLYEIKAPAPEIDPIKDLVGFKNGRPVWARIAGEKAELFYY